MHPNRGLRASAIAAVLLLGSLLPALLITPIATAASTGSQTTFYFKDALSEESFLNASEDPDNLFGFIPVSQMFPTKQNDSRYPPKLTNIEDMTLWLATWSFYLLEDSEEFNLSDLIGLFGNDSLEGYDITLLFPHPLRVVETYTNPDNETIEINGDVKFDLYFDSHFRNIRKTTKDTVVVGLYSLNMESLLPLPKLILNKTIQIDSKLFIKKQTIILENISHSLGPGESLVFTIEIIPGEKLISNLIESDRPALTKILEIGKKIFDSLKITGNQSKIKFIQNLRNLTSIVNEFIEEFNITKEDFATIVESINAFTSCFVYDSLSHPSSVTVPLTVPNGEGNNIQYYLRNENVLSEEKPGDSTTAPFDISSTTAIWEGPSLQRSKILKSAVAYVYVDSVNFLRKNTIIASLLNGEVVLASSTVELSGDYFKPNKPLVFTFNDINTEIAYNEKIKITIGLEKKAGVLDHVKIYYDSEQYPSALSIKFSDTNNIGFTTTSDPVNGLIVPGGQVTFTLNITCIYADDLSVNILDNKQGEWDVSTIQTTPVSIPSKGTTQIEIIAQSTNDKKEAYGNRVDMTFVVSGHTGITRQSASAEVSEDAIVREVNIVNYTERKNIERGGERAFYFIIENKNTGAVDDTDNYTITATSEHDWDLLYTQHIDGLLINKRTEAEAVQVRVSVPENTSITSDTITVTVTSDSDSAAFDTVNVTVSVIGPDIFESIYGFFESLSTSLGFDEIFGSSGPIAVIAILMVIVLFIIIILALVFTRKFVRIICTNRIQEIDAGNEAVFNFTLQNPMRKINSYQVSLGITPSMSKWQISTDSKSVTVEGRQSHPVEITVKPTETISSADWLELPIRVNQVGKKKTATITVLVTIKEGKPLLQITDVFSWPVEFNPGERITTTFKVENKGPVIARKVIVFLFINGKIKNRATVSIPSGSIADIQMPWIAIKGKNQLLIRLKE